MDTSIKGFADVPTWEGVLQYRPEDLVADRPLTFYRLRRKRTREGKIVQVRYPLKASLSNKQNSKKRARYPNTASMMRRCISFSLRGVFRTLYCSHLTMLCLTGFAIADRRHWVVDHINADPADDRPSNLQVISQRENCRRSQRLMAKLKRLNERNKQQSNLE